MKKIKFLFLLTALLSVLITAGCDSFQDFSVNIPFTIEFVDSTYNTQTFDSEVYDLGANSQYNDYKEKIKDFEFLEARYFIKATVPDTLVGTLKFTVRKNDNAGDILFYKEFPGVTVYNGKTDIFVLTQDQIKMFNDYLYAMYALSGTTKFYGEAAVTDLANDGNLKKTTVELHLLLKAEGEL
jgi:hypothetical protein